MFYFWALFLIEDMKRPKISDRIKAERSAFVRGYWHLSIKSSVERRVIIFSSSSKTNEKRGDWFLSVSSFVVDVCAKNHFEGHNVPTEGTHRFNFRHRSLLCCWHLKTKERRIFRVCCVWCTHRQGHRKGRFVLPNLFALYVLCRRRPRLSSLSFSPLVKRSWPGPFASPCITVEMLVQMALPNGSAEMS